MPTKPEDLFSVLRPGRKITITKGAHKGRKGYIHERVTLDTDPRLITGRCVYGIHFHEGRGAYNAEGDPNTWDFARHEFAAHAGRT